MSIRHPDALDAARALLHSDKPYTVMTATASTNNEHHNKSTCFSGVPHINANRKKKAKRKQAQASRRNNRR